MTSTAVTGHRSVNVSRLSLILRTQSIVFVVVVVRHCCYRARHYRYRHRQQLPRVHQKVHHQVHADETSPSSTITVESLSVACYDLNPIHARSSNKVLVLERSSYACQSGIAFATWFVVLTSQSISWLSSRERGRKKESWERVCRPRIPEKLGHATPRWPPGLETITLANEGRELGGRGVVRDIELFRGFVRVVREVRAGPCPAVVIMVNVLIVSIGVDGVGDDVVALMLLSQQFLQTDDQADDEGDLADDKSLERDQRQSAEGDRDKGGGLQFQEEENWHQGFHDFLLLAASWNVISKYVLTIVTWDSSRVRYSKSDASLSVEPRDCRYNVICCVIRMRNLNRIRWIKVPVYRMRDKFQVVTIRDTQTCI